jgi:hypothetical protein
MVVSSQQSAFSNQQSAISFQHSAFSIQHSAFRFPLSLTMRLTNSKADR